MSRSELCRYLMRAYLMWARELQKQSLSYGWLLEQIRDVDELRRHFKYIEEEPTATFIFKEVA